MKDERQRSDEHNERFATLAAKVHLDAVESVKMSICDMGAALPKEKADERLTVWQNSVPVLLTATALLPWHCRRRSFQIDARVQ